MPGCSHGGEFRAPKDRSLSEHYWFCMDHIREYNMAWDFFSGMSSAEVEDHILKSAFWDRPTWKFADPGAAEDQLRRKAWQTHNFTDEEPPRGDGFGNGNGHSYGVDRNSPEFQALAIMGLEPPVDLAAIKSRYKDLAKKHHPDRNHGDPKSEELLKHINMAYTVLKLAYEKYDQLEPETNQ